MVNKRKGGERLVPSKIDSGRRWGAAITYCVGRATTDGLRCRRSSDWIDCRIVLQFSPVGQGKEPRLSTGELHDDADVRRHIGHYNDRSDRSHEPDVVAPNSDRR